MSRKTPREALTQIFGLGTTPGAVVTRATPAHLADEVLRELEAQGFEIVDRRPRAETRTSRWRPMRDGIDYDSSEQ